MNSQLKNKNIMKKSLLTFILGTMAMGIGYAQFTDGMVMQPSSVVAKHFDASGQLINEMTSSFTYDEDGKLIRYDFPDHQLWSTYTYNNDLLMQEYTRHEGGHPVYSESFQYTYENYKVKTKSHLWGAMNASEYWIYDYNSEGRVERIDYKDEYDDDYHMHWLYEYENDGKTKIENYWTSWINQGMLLRKKTVYQYDEAYNLLTTHVENYSVEGELVQTTLTTYTYTPSGKKDSEITQTLTDGEWDNTEIIRYVYDDNDRVTEWQVGAWSDEKGDWTLTNKTIYALDEEALTLTMTFYKKSGEEWTWEDYGWLVNHIQPLFYEPYLTEQEHALRFHAYDDLYDSEHINQFVFTLTETNEPTYVNTHEQQGSKFSIFPNPSQGQLKVESPLDNTVIRIYNLQGQLVMAKLFDFNTDINAENLPSGIYLWEIWHNSQKQACGKWVKE